MCIRSWGFTKENKLRSNIKFRIMENTQKEKLMERVNATLDQVRPYLQADGGDI